jgi:geranylgeranyl diphosphate synthase type II
MDAGTASRTAAWRAEVEELLRRRLERANLPAALQEAARYAALSPGKRLRPILTLHCCEVVGGAVGAALPAAGAIELIHAFSLVHDDLPAMDDDDLRRGLPTVHVKYGEAMAILTGDLLAALAFDTLAEEVEAPALAGRLSGELARATSAMIAGQVYDTFAVFPPDLDDRERLELIHRNKTGALIRCAARLGAISGGADDRTLADLTGFAEALGVMFQITDDLLDVTQPAESVGKRTGKDAPAGKLTFPGLLGVEGARQEVERLEEAALTALNRFGPDAEPLRELCRAISVRTK